MAVPVDPIAVALSVGQTLDALGVRYTIGGSLASSVAGEPRSTVDIDFVVALDSAQIPRLVAALGTDFYADTDALQRAVRNRSSANLIHHATQLKVDLFIAGGTALDEQQLERRQAIETTAGRLYVHPPEDILLQKLRGYQAGGGTSDRQWRDILGIVRVQGTRLDREYLAVNAPVLGVADLLTRALQEG